MPDGTPLRRCPVALLSAFLRGNRLTSVARQILSQRVYVFSLIISPCAAEVGDCLKISPKRQQTTERTSLDHDLWSVQSFSPGTAKADFLLCHNIGSCRTVFFGSFARFLLL